MQTATLTAVIHIVWLFCERRKHGTETFACLLITLKQVKNRFNIIFWINYLQSFRLQKYLDAAARIQIC